MGGELFLLFFFRFSLGASENIGNEGRSGEKALMTVERRTSSLKDFGH